MQKSTIVAPGYSFLHIVDDAVGLGQGLERRSLASMSIADLPGVGKN